MQIQLKPPGGSQVINMPLDGGWQQFTLAAGAALVSAIVAAYLPARKASRVVPVAILRRGLKGAFFKDTKPCGYPCWRSAGNDG